MTKVLKPAAAVCVCCGKPSKKVFGFFEPGVKAMNAQKEDIGVSEMIACTKSCAREIYFGTPLSAKIPKGAKIIELED